MLFSLRSVARVSLSDRILVKAMHVLWLLVVMGFEPRKVRTGTVCHQVVPTVSQMMVACASVIDVNADQSKRFRGEGYGGYDQLNPTQRMNTGYSNEPRQECLRTAVRRECSTAKTGASRRRRRERVVL